MVGKCIGKRIAELRKKRNMTQEELSETIGISPHYLSALERGIYNIKLEKLVMIINALDCTADDIFCDVINNGYLLKANRLSDKLDELPRMERNKIFDVVEAMIKNA